MARTEYRTRNCLASHNFQTPSGTPTEGLKKIFKNNNNNTKIYNAHMSQALSMNRRRESRQRALRAEHCIVGIPHNAAM